MNGWASQDCTVLENREILSASKNMLYMFMFSKKAIKNEEIFTVDLMLCSKCQIEGEHFVNFCGLLRKHKL